MEISLENWRLDIKHLTSPLQDEVIWTMTRSLSRPAWSHLSLKTLVTGPVLILSRNLLTCPGPTQPYRCRIVTQRSFLSFLGRSVTRQKQLRGRLGVLTIYIGKQETPIGKSNALHHFVWKFQEIKAVIWNEAIFLLFWVCLADLNILWGGRSDNKTFIVLCLWTRFLPG